MQISLTALVIGTVIAAGTGRIFAAEDGDTPHPWSHALKAGAYLGQTASGGADTSRDPTITDTVDTMSYRLALDGSLTWWKAPHEVQHELRLRFGRTREEDRAWTENEDLIRYDLTGLHFLWGGQRDLLYAAGRIESVFTGEREEVLVVHPLVRPELDRLLGPHADAVPDTRERDPRFFSPGLAHLASGVGQRYRDLLLPTADKLEWRLGVRAQKRWGTTLTSSERDLAIGCEAVLTYENQIRENTDWFIHAESFAPFNDIAHITSWAEAGLDIALHTYINLRISGRCYYESHPEEIGPRPNDGYDELSWRQEALIGLHINL